jgi:subtilisin family serine protease
MCLAKTTSQDKIDELKEQFVYQNEMANVSLGILQAWKSNYTGKGVSISIVDDGVDYRHIDLINRYVSFFPLKWHYEHPKGKYDIQNKFTIYHNSVRFYNVLCMNNK